MIRSLSIPLCICCTVLCGFVAYLSQQAIDDQAALAVDEGTSIRCQDLMKDPPTEKSNLCLKDFEPGKYFSTRDWDDDEAWELVSVPFFPNEYKTLADKNSYAAAIIKFSVPPTVTTSRSICAPFSPCGARARM